MKKIIKEQAGIAHLGLILVSGLALLIVGVATYRVVENRNGGSEKNSISQTEGEGLEVIDEESAVDSSVDSLSTSEEQEL